MDFCQIIHSIHIQKNVYAQKTSGSRQIFREWHVLDFMYIKPVAMVWILNVLLKPYVLVAWSSWQHNWNTVVPLRGLRGRSLGPLGCPWRDCGPCPTLIASCPWSKWFCYVIRSCSLVMKHCHITGPKPQGQPLWTGTFKTESQTFAFDMLLISGMLL